MATTRKDATYSVSSEVSHREIEGQILILLPDSSYLYTLNATGQLLWEQILQGRTADELAERLCEEFGVGGDTARKDVRLFLNQLKRKGIISATQAE
jgi:hypothetical protein